MFIGIDAMIVELFAAVSIADVAPVLTADRMIFIIPCGEYWSLSFGLGVVEQGFQVEAVELLLREVTEGREGWVDVDEADWTGIHLILFRHSWIGDEKRDTSGLFPKGLFTPMFLFPEMLSMIGPEDNDGIVGMWAIIERSEDFSELVIDESGAG